MIVVTNIDTTQAGLKAALRTAILACSDWAQPNAGGAPNLLKATTTRGAVMCVDLDNIGGTTPNLTYHRLRVMTWVDHDGTTGTDSMEHSVYFKYTNTGATAMKVRGVVSASKDHLFFTLEGPNGGESYAEDANWGSHRSSFYIGDLVPYHAADTTPVVVVAAPAASSDYPDSVNQNGLAFVSRNYKDTVSWVPARLGTITYPTWDGSHAANLRNACEIDGNQYLWPWLVSETRDGLRGRLANLFYVGNIRSSPGWVDNAAISDQQLSYGGDEYLTVYAQKYGLGPFGATDNVTASISGPVVAVRKS